MPDHKIGKGASKHAESLVVEHHPTKVWIECFAAL